MTIVTARTIPSGPAPTGAAQGSTALEVPAHGEVRGISRPSSDSEITCDVWLPVTG